MPRAQELIATAYRRFAAEVPALGNLKLTIRLELRGRGDVQVFGVRVPGPIITKGEPDGARLELAMPRADFNELAEILGLAGDDQPLEGVFITTADDPPAGTRLAVKDILDTAGIRTTYGS